MSPEELSRAWPVFRYGEIDSTNEEARRRAVSGDIGPAWITAEAQTAGRGRLGRTWASPPGNLFATGLFRFLGKPADAALICFSAGLAVIDAAQAAGVDASGLRLKWPNDVELGAAKLAGVLIETGVTPGGLWVAAGFGVNVATAPARPDRQTACLAHLPGGETLTAAAFLAKLDIAFRGRLMRLMSEGFEPTRADWLARAAHLGKRVELTPAAGRISGVVRGMDLDGALILELDDGAMHHVRAGEISLLG
jgi:BirA family biotin operon repressor/biotin-[acetyl-CoA-carboxylase] ligase